MLCLCTLGGSSDETSQTIGLTHLLEHMLFKSVGSKGPGELAREMDFLGSEISAFTDFDSLCLHSHVSSEKAPEALEFMVKMLADSSFTGSDLENEKGVIRQEIVDNRDDPGEAVYSSFMSNFWPDSPLGWPVSGNIETLESFTCEDLESRRQILLSGERVVVVAVGDFDETQLAGYCEDLFSNSDACFEPSIIPGPSVPGLYFAPKPVTQVYFSMGCKFPGVKDEDFEVASVVNSIFGEGMSSRLFQSLREDAGLAYDVSSEVDSYAETSAFLINLQTEPVNFDKAFKIIANELQKLREFGLTEEELERVVSLRRQHLKIDNDSISRRLWRILESEVYFAEAYSEQKELTKLDSLSMSSVNNFIEKYLVNSRFVMVLGGAQEDAKFVDGALLAGLL